MALKAKKKPVSSSKSKPAAVVRPIKQTLTKSALIGLIAEQNDVPRKQVADILASLECAMLGSIHPNGAGTFIFPGLFKVYLRKVPARKAGTLIRNPATGEMMKASAKPATVRVKVRALSKMKKAAV
jgi:nucleoid DNA-binding protein